MASDLVLIDGGANTKLARDIADELGVDLVEDCVRKFADSETQVKVDVQVRGKHVFIIQPTSQPANESYMNLLILIDAIARGSAKTITVVMPYFGYARQDRKDKPRVPITAKLISNLLTSAGATRILALDIHAHQIQGFFDIPLDHLYARNIFLDKIRSLGKNLVIVSPDVGGAKMAQGFSERLGLEMAIVHKKRISDSETEVSSIVGDVDGKDVVLVDDIVATAGSLCEGAKALKKAGAGSIYCAISHGVLSGPAIERIKDSEIKTMFITDSILQPKDKRIPQIEVLSCAPLLAEAIKRVNTDGSVSELFTF